MAKLKKKPISQANLCKFIKLHGGKNETGVSPFKVAAFILRARGIEQDMVTDKLFVYNNSEIMLSDIGINKSVIVVNKKTPATKKKSNKSNNFVITKEFLLSYEWRKLRLVALKLHGATCQCCGASPKTGAVMNVDHIKPRKHYPELALDINNLQVLCAECNHGKGNWDKTDFR